MDLPPDLHGAALRRIARALLYDDALALDAAQDAWLAAVGEPGGRAQPRSGAWFGGVVRRIALSMRRDASRRRERERRAARPEGLPSTADALAHVELVRNVVDAVARLDEPYRTAIALRYFDDLPPRAIAAQLGVPVNTVKARLKRGLQSLRRDLLGRDREQLSGLAAIAAGAGFRTFAGEVGVMVMGKKVAAAAAALVCLVALLATARSLGWLGGRGERATEPVAALTAASAPALSEALARAEDSAGPTAQRAPSEATASWSVSGHVLLDGEDAPGAELVGELLESREADARVVRSWSFRTDERGDYVWRLDPPAAPFRLRWSARIPGASCYPLQDDFSPEEEPSCDWLVEATKDDCTLRGRVNDDAGAPLAGARITLRGRAASVVTTGDGCFSIAASSTWSTATLDVVADGFGTYVHGLGQILPGERKLEHFALAREVELRGRVLDPSGAPVVGASVWAWEPHKRGVSITATDGSFELAGVDPRARDVYVVASAVGFVRNAVGVQGEAGKAGLVELRLERGARVAGRVLSLSGAPIGGVLVWANDAGDGTPRPDETRWTDAEGAFAFDALEGGERSLWTIRRGYVSSRVRVVVPDDASPVEGLELRLATGRALVGRVQQSDGTPVPWAHVGAEQAGVADVHVDWLGVSTYSGRDGRFRFNGIVAQTPQLTVLKRGFARAVSVPEPDASGEYVVTLERAASFATRFVDAATGEPLSTVRVRIRPSHARPNDYPIGLPSYLYRFTQVATRQGVWRVDAQIQRGSAVCLDVQADGYVPARVDPFVSERDAELTTPTVALATSTLVRGSLELEGSGAPVAGARIRAFWHRDELRMKQDEETRVATSDAAGHFEFENLPPGPVSLSIKPLGGVASIDGPFDVLANTTTLRHIRVASIEGATIRGRLLDADGHGLAGERITAFALGDVAGEQRRWSAETGVDGAYALNGLQPGDYHITWERKRGAEGAWDMLELVHVDANQTLEHDLRPTGSARIIGRVEADFALPELIVVRVVLSPTKPVQWAHWARAVFAERGSFEVRGVPPGRYSALASFQGANRRLVYVRSAFFEVAEGDAEIAVVLRVQDP